MTVTTVVAGGGAVLALDAFDQNAVDGIVITVFGGAVLAAVIYVTKRVSRTVDTVKDFLAKLTKMLEDWCGHPADPARGFDAQLSIPERLKALEYDSKRNGGVDRDSTGRVDGTTKDIVANSNESIEEVRSDIATINAMLQRLLPDDESS